mgnify:CR=1 FL=1
MARKNIRKSISRNSPKQNKRPPTWVKKEMARLVAAILIFAGCFIGKSCIPAVQSQFAPMLQNLLSCSCDFEEAVRCFSAQLESGNDVGDALEDFCVTAFAAQTSQRETESNPERVALMNTIAYCGTLTDGY